MSLSENGESAELNPRQTELAVCEANCWKRKAMLMKKLEYQVKSNDKLRLETIGEDGE